MRRTQRHFLVSLFNLFLLDPRLGDSCLVLLTDAASFLCESSYGAQ